ncbi:MAG: hypothetical protein ABI051_13905 [Vicinamibacterales bacterium]
MTRFLTALAGCALAVTLTVGAQTKPPAQATKPQTTKPATPTPTAKPAAKAALPPAVSAAFKKAYPNATIQNVSKETERGKTVYEVESMDGPQRRDLIYATDGTVVYYEELIGESDVPAVVVAAIKTRYPKATISTRERLFKAGTMNYEFILKGAGVSEVILTPEGKWVSPKAQ